MNLPKTFDQSFNKQESDNEHPCYYELVEKGSCILALMVLSVHIMLGC